MSQTFTATLCAIFAGVVFALNPARSACAQDVRPADLVLEHGKIVTLDPVQGQVDAVAARGGSIVATGTNAEIEAYVGSSTREIDLEGRLVVPGFIDSHAHFMGLGQALDELNFMDDPNWSTIVEKVADAAAEAEPGAWILGRGWHQEKWDTMPSEVVEGVPTNAQLNEAAPRNPVLLTHASGHSAIANERALELAGITPETPDPEGGDIVRDEKGRATGLLRDNAEDLVRKALREARAERSPAQVEQALRRQVQRAGRDALKKGVTSFQDQGEDFETIDFLKKMAGEGALPLRLYVFVGQGEVTREQQGELAAHRMVGYGNDHLTVRAVGEVTADGALGSHSAWFIEPYADQPNSNGLNVTSPQRIREIGEIALAEDFQVATHAIGDKANRKTLDVYEQIFKEHPKARDLRWRIEHSQHLNPDDLPRFAELGVIASMQGIHACSDGPYVVKRLGRKRARQGAYVWDKLRRSGALVLNGTDAPVEDVDPLASFHCTVTRKLSDGSTFFPEQALTREQALRTYTINGARAAFEEDLKGTIAPSKLADMVVLSKDIMTVPADEILDAKVLYTILGGEVVYSKANGYRTGRSGSEDMSGR